MRNQNQGTSHPNLPETEITRDDREMSSRYLEYLVLETSERFDIDLPGRQIDWIRNFRRPTGLGLKSTVDLIRRARKEEILVPDGPDFLKIKESRECGNWYADLRCTGTVSARERFWCSLCWERSHS